MPELPEVETVKNDLKKQVLYKKNSPYGCLLE